VIHRRSMNEEVAGMKLKIEVAILEICEMAGNRGYGWGRQLRVGGSLSIAKPTKLAAGPVFAAH
jgi:hypothetical protein